jgi:hypothetical protein
MQNFSIFKVEITKSKKLYDVKKETETGTQIKKELIDIAYIDANPLENGQPNKDEILKFYSPNGAIVEGCKDMIKKYPPKGKDGNLSEPVEIEAVMEKEGEGKNAYLYFT